ncbi:MAG TPA: YdeI/OmpD-associated family protein [Saprospiraceae bacterium]|nr:YdeI/OmpD-associated family protein [Saprospiraceae bacterium]HMU03189.1 YdeI/OmpD-associated family protein [Saprospiraceae bacterium]
MTKKEVEIFYPKNKKEWRVWLENNHARHDNVWVVFYKKACGIPTISWSDSVDEALCFGWIDSKKIAIDSEKSHQFFSKRKPKSTWSKINKEKVERLIAEGLMTKAGLECIEIAKQNGSWTMLDDVDALIIPPDLEAAFERYPRSKAFFESLSPSIKKMMLYWIISAKQKETRQKRINEIAEMAGQNQKPKQF